MGRLRSKEDIKFLGGFAAEVNELFGTLDCALHRYMAAWPENLANKDPLWQEPKTTTFYKEFKVPMMWMDLNTTEDASEFGHDANGEATAYVAVKHLMSLNVPTDHEGAYINIGDVIAVHTQCGHRTTYYDIIDTSRDGWVNDSDEFLQYKLTLTRKQKYAPERKL